MSHTHIRAGGPGCGHSRAVMARGTTVFLAAQAPVDPDSGESVGGDDPAAQADAVMRGIRATLAECRAEMADLCRLVVHLADIGHREAVLGALAGHLAKGRPVVTVAAVQAMARPEWLVEIEATAVIPDTTVPAELDPNVAIAAAEAGAEAPIPREPARGRVPPPKALEGED